jgi:hypothetical protein
VFLHPIDAKHRQAIVAEVQFENPIDHPLLAEFGIEALLFPGHTAGHIIFHSTNNAAAAIVLLVRALNSVSLSRICALATFIRKASCFSCQWCMN